MQAPSIRLDPSSETPLSTEDLVILQEACGPVELLKFPPVQKIQGLRRQGYITIVLGGVQITPLGLERLLRERMRMRIASRKGTACSIG
ncbi:hypothetical protein P7D22_03430 [Lichenihabitans sp. Uapishka_5]|uniref:hypothetical protein n=1 Tax=Lichenihabitans sp. Uapishka_5 TaxID=3037302 RepID=UPI0029E826F3|nr:hypothetical protein [Lichenihabitans sp. Uapishka_5]MDX7950230.1 hypothetical protein [Lichenihabitans sp. Uapishka_5]